MKKIFCTLVCLLVLAGCGGSSKPEGMSDEDFKVSQNIIDVLDQYISGEVSNTSASTRVEHLADQIKGEDHVSVMVSIGAESAVRYLVKDDVEEVKAELSEIEGYLK